MDRKRKSNASYYRASPAAVGTYRIGDVKKKKNKNIISYIITLLIIISVLAGILFSASIIGDTGRKDIGKITKIAASLNQNITPFGDSVIFYDNYSIHCITATGGNEWSYQIGQNADYHATDNRVVAWVGNDLYIFNDKGRLIYNNKMSDIIQFARVGKEYTGVFIGDSDNGVVTVINSDGQVVDNISVSNQTVLDIGFFESVTTGTQKVELMWMLGLNTSGTVISTELQTFQPGRLLTGKSSLGEHIAYKVYDANGIMNVVTTRQIMHFNYRVLEYSEPTLIYGYTVEDVKKVDTTTYQLLIPSKEQANGNQINNIRIMYGSMDRMIHLPKECIAATLGTRSIYAFSNNMVYACRYGETTFRAFPVSINITAVLGMITDNRVIVSSDSSIYVIELPM